MGVINLLNKFYAKLINKMVFFINKYIFYFDE